MPKSIKNGHSRLQLLCQTRKGKGRHAKYMTKEKERKKNIKQGIIFIKLNETEQKKTKNMPTPFTSALVTVLTFTCFRFTFGAGGGTLCFCCKEVQVKLVGCKG